MLARAFARLLLVLLVLAALLPATATAQDVAPTVIAASEPPTQLVGNDVTSFSVPSPGLFWQTDGFCPPRPPAAAAEGEAAPVDPASPQAPDRASDFTIKRMTVRGDEVRTLMRRIDPTIGEPDWVCDQYSIRSNIVADASYIYWVDATGLVRLPVTANVGDAPQGVDSYLAGDEEIELVMTPDRVLALVNIPGSQFALGSSTVYAYNKAAATNATLKFYLLNQELNDLSWDGEYVYYRLGGSNDLVRLDSAGNDPTIANNIGTHFSEGRRTVCGLTSCTTTHYVFYTKGDRIWRYNNLNGENIQIQDRVGNVIDLVAAPRGILGLLTGNSLFWFESIFTPCEPQPCFGGTYTYVLNRAGRGVNSTPEQLYFYNDTSITPISPSGLTSNGEFLFWAQGTQFLGRLLRLPNDVDALPKVDMSVTGYEVTQAVQRDDNGVRQVQGRSTFVRVFVQSAGQNVPGATMRLYAFFNGQEHGPLVPLKGTHITAKPAPNRNTLGDGFLFQLPHDWTLQPQITLRAVLNPFQVPAEPTYGNNELSGAVVSFSQAYPIHLILYEANYRIQTSVSSYTDYEVPDPWASIDWIRRAYPIAEDGLSYQIRTINGGLQLGNRVTQAAQVCQDMPADQRSLCASDWVMAKIGEMAANPNFNVPGDAYLYGLILDSGGIGGAFPRGQAGGRIGAGPTGTSITASSYSDYGFYTGHEVGHELGRPHPSPNSDDPATTVDGMGNPIIEGCGHSRSDNNYPHALARIGPGNGSVRGFDRDRPSLTGLSRFAVLDDVNAYDMMSYCGDSQLRWPSDYTWELMYQRLQQDAQVNAAGAQAPLAGAFIGLFGAVYGSDVVVQNVVTLDGSMVPPPAGPGDFTVKLLGAANNELASYPFQPEQGVDSGRPFAVVVPLPDGTRRVQIVATAGGPALFDHAISANAPVVSSVTLPGAPNPVDGDVTVAWSATDAEGGTLVFDLYYSFDNAVTFQPVAFGLTGSSTVVDTSTLGGGMGIFRVVASDGANQGSGDSAPFQMAVKPPIVRIASPDDGATYNWGQLVHLSGDALDSLDGLLPDGSLVWSNQNGALGTGAILDVTDLPVGLNVITLSAQNSAGLSATDQISITVGDTLELPGPLLAASPEALSFQFAPGSTATATQAVNLANVGGSATLAWAAESSAPWLTLDAAAGDDVPAAIQATADPAGLEVGVEHRATITITGTPQGGAAQVRVVPVALTIGNTTARSLSGQPDALGGLRVYLPLVAR